MKSKNNKRNNSNKKTQTLLNKKTKRPKKESTSNKKEKVKEQIVQTTVTKDLSISMKSANKKYELVKCLIDDLDFLTFILFQSVNKKSYIIYIKVNKGYDSSHNYQEKKMIACYDIINEQMIFGIKNPHSDDIEDIKHILDKKNKRDLIISISPTTIKIWNFKNMQVLYVINKQYQDKIFSNIINIINNDDYIHINEAISSSNIITYNIDGQKIGTIKNYKKILNIESFTDSKTKKSYMIVNYNDCLVSFDHDKNKQYVKYCHDTYNERFKIIIKEDGDNIKLIGLGCNYPFIIIWDFHSGKKLCDIYLKEKIKSVFILGINNSFLWDNKYLCLCFTRSHKFKLLECSLKLFDLKKYVICEDVMFINERNIWKIERFEHPLYGDCLITQYSAVKIEIWKLKGGKEKNL